LKSQKILEGIYFPPKEEQKKTELFPKHITLLTIGSRGDVQPLVAFGKVFFLF